MTAPEQDWLERLRMDTPVQPDGKGGWQADPRWPLLCDCIEAAKKAEHEYELCRVGADDGEFALWSEERLYTALHDLAPKLAALKAEVERDE